MGVKIKDLIKQWNFKTDPEGKGEEEKWYLTGVKGREVDVSQPWQVYSGELIDYTGAAWYSREFRLSSELKSKRLFIKFLAVDYKADVWFNGNYLGSHEGGYTPFKFEITDCINYGENNLLVVKVFDPKDNKEIPRGKQGSWYTRVSGIWQDVRIIGYEENFIENVLITPEVTKERVKFDIKLDEPRDIEKGSELEIKVFSPREKGRVEKKCVYDQVKDCYLKLEDPLLWSPEEPWIYNVEVNLKNNKKVVDKYETYFGMRKIEQREGQIYLNGEPLYIRGALDQGFWPDKIYKPNSEEEIKNEIKQAKKMGFNLLRKHIKTEDPRYLYWADHLGILIWAEAPNYAKWTPQARNRFKDEYTKMVTRDYNHPAIIIWSIYNEEWGLEWDLAKDKEKQEWVIDFYDYASKLDPTRLICDNSGWAHVKTDISDLHRYFAAPDNYKEWKRDIEEYIIGDPEANFVSGKEYNEEPLIVSEFGMWSLPEVERIKDYYGKLPDWYYGSTQLFSEDFKVPVTAEENFTKYRLDEIFSDFNELARATQRREFRGVKYLIEEMRKHEEIAGYVVTELTDVEWETNGFLDYFRSPKESPRVINNYNGAVSVMMDIESRNLWQGETFVAQPYLVNNTHRTIKGKLNWRVKNTEIKGQKKVEVNSNETIKLPEKIKFIAPDVEKAEKFTLYYHLDQNGEVIAENKEELTVSSFNFIERSTINTIGLSKELKTKLKEAGYVLNADSKSLWVTKVLTNEVLDHLKAGRKVLFLAEEGAEIKDKGLINFRQLTDGEDWDRAASFNYLNADYFKELPLNKISGWELADLFPSYVIDNLDDLNWDQILGGYFVGWLGDFGGSLVTISVGQGELTVTTLKLAKNYFDQPIGTLLFDKLVQILQAEGEE